MNTFHLQITTPEGVLYDGDAQRVSVRACSGDLAIMAGHIPLVTALSQGECRVLVSESELKKAECSGGMLSVTKEIVRLLSTDFKWTEN